MSENVYRTGTGVEIPIRPVNPARTQAVRLKILHEYQARGEVLDPPTYEVEVGMKGEKQKFPHTATSILVEGVTDEEKAAWAKYIESKTRLENEQQTAVLELLLLRGTTYPMPEDDGWAQELEYDGVPVETETHKRYIQYLLYEVLASQFDQTEICRRIIMLSIHGSDPAWIQSVEESFRGKAGRAERAEAGGDTVSTGGG